MIKRESIKVQVFAQLRDQILDGTWSRGSKIPSENELAQMLGVSRVSIREGLQMLVTLGLLETRHGEGTFVKESHGAAYLNELLPMLALGETDVFHVLEYRRIVEKGTVEIVVEKADEDFVGELWESYAELERSANDVEAFARADLAFHLLLAEGTGNPIVIKVTEIIRSVLSASMRDIVSNLGVQDGLYYHKKIIEAVAARDGPSASRLMEEHVTKTIDRLRSESLRRSGGPGRN